MKPLKLMIIGALTVFGPQAWAGSDEIVLLTKSGATARTRAVSLSGEEYSSRLRILLSSANEAILPAVTRQEHHGGWKLKAVLVGIGLKLEAGLGPVLEFAAKPRLRLVYTPRNSSFFPEGN